MVRSYTLVDGRPTFIKDPEAVLDYTLDFSAWLEAGEILLTQVPEAKGVTLVSSGIVGGTAVTFWVSGGRKGTTGLVRIRVATSLGRTDDAQVFFRIQNH